MQRVKLFRPFMDPGAPFVGPSKPIKHFCLAAHTGPHIWSDELYIFIRGLFMEPARHLHILKIYISVAHLGDPYELSAYECK